MEGALRSSGHRAPFRRASERGPYTCRPQGFLVEMLLGSVARTGVTPGTRWMVFGKGVAPKGHPLVYDECQVWKILGKYDPASAGASWVLGPWVLPASSGGKELLDMGAGLSSEAPQGHWVKMYFPPPSPPSPTPLHSLRDGASDCAFLALSLVILCPFRCEAH